MQNQQEEVNIIIEGLPRCTDENGQEILRKRLFKKYGIWGGMGLNNETGSYQFSLHHISYTDAFKKMQELCQELFGFGMEYIIQIWQCGSIKRKYPVEPKEVKQ